MASLFRPTYKCKRTGKLKRTKKWYAKYRGPDGVVRKVPLSANKDAARVMLGELLTAAERERAGVKDPFAEHRKVPLTGHLAAYHASYAAAGHTARQADRSVTRCRAVFDACQFVYLADLNAEAASAWLSARRQVSKKDGGFGPKTSNHYAGSVKAFGSWCVRTRRLAANPFQFVAMVNPDLDIRRPRRDLSPEELTALIDAARSGKPFRRLSGPDRAMLYTVAGYTGLRASELASLTSASFSLDGTPPTVVVKAAHSKHRREDTVPLHPELVDLLRPWLAAKPSGGRLWPGKWAENHEAVDLIQRDLSAARSAWITAATTPTERDRREASDFLVYRDRRGFYADFHSLRHTFITRLVQAGVMPKDAKELARHSTIALTIDRYAHVTQKDLAAAVAKLSGPAGTSSGTSGGPAPSNVLENKGICDTTPGGRSPPVSAPLSPGPAGGRGRGPRHPGVRRGRRSAPAPAVPAAARRSRPRPPPSAASAPCGSASPGPGRPPRSP